jgi:ribosomal protein S18 acetylase RimI-like enzyme
MTERSSLGRSAAAEDVPAVTACLASAFDEDPVWGRWAYPEPTSRTARLYALMGFWVAGAVRHRCVRMTDGAGAVTVWLPPGAADMTAAQEAGLEAFVTETLGPRADQVLSLFERFDELHPRDRPHYYLSIWGTHRDHAGRGLGTALLHEDLARIDAEEMGAYLESTNPANIPRYEALGFRRRGEFGPTGGPIITTMWREARGTPPAL